MEKAKEHATKDDGFADIPPELVDKARAAIRDEEAAAARQDPAQSKTDPIFFRRGFPVLLAPVPIDRTDPRMAAGESADPPLQSLS